MPYSPRHLVASLGEPTMPRLSEVLPALAKELADAWGKPSPSQSRVSGELEPDFRVSPQVYDCLDRIVRARAEVAGQPRVGGRLAVALFRSLDRRANDFIHLWIIKAFDAEYDFFVARAHLAESADKIPSDEGLMTHFEAFERVFHSLVGPYFSGKEELDTILREPYDCRPVG